MRRGDAQICGMSMNEEGKVKVAGLVQGAPAAVDADEKAGTGAESADTTDENGTPWRTPPAESWAFPGAEGGTRTHTPFGTGT